MWLLTARAFLKRIPWQAYAILALLAVWYIDRTRHGNERAYEARAEMQAKIDRADAERAKALASEEEALRNLAQRTDTDVAKEREANRDSTEQFIARGGVRNTCPRSGQAPRDGAGSGEGVHQAPELDDPETVSVKPDDVRICTDNTLTAEALQAYILGLQKPK